VFGTVCHLYSYILFSRVPIQCNKLVGLPLSVDTLCEAGVFVIASNKKFQASMLVSTLLASLKFSHKCKAKCNQFFIISEMIISKNSPLTDRLWEMLNKI